VRAVAALALAIACFAAVSAAATRNRQPSGYLVDHVADGDTITLQNQSSDLASRDEPDRAQLTAGG